MPDGKYNGFTNYETWLVHLWMGAEEGSQAFFNDAATQVHSETDAYNTGFTTAEMASMRFADWLKHYSEVEDKPAVRGVYGDLLGAALSSVNWDEIARHWMDAVLEEVANDPLGQ